MDIAQPIWAALEERDLRQLVKHLRRDRFTSQSLSEQRKQIREHIERNSYDVGLFGEALNEHDLAGDYRAALLSGDAVRAGELADLMTREYFASVIESEWAMEDDA